MLEFIYALYAAVCACWLGLRYRRLPQEAIIRFVFAVSFPIVGFLFPLFLMRKDTYGSSDKLESYLHEDAQAEAYPVARILNTDKEINVIPLEEMLLAGDLTTRRRSMIELLNQDATDYLEVLRMAVANDDTETSHYAVSAIVEIKRKLNRSLQDLSVRYESCRGDAEFLSGYAEVLRNYIRSGFLDYSTLQRLKYNMAEVLQDRIAADPGALDAYNEKVNIELELGNYAAAEQVALVFADRFPDHEEPYLLLLSLYYILRSPQKFHQALLRLKQSNVRLSSDGLKTVRFWSKGA
jgi:hypothetical protein